MARVRYQIRLQGGDEVGGLMRFEPGSRMDGLAEVLPNENIPCRSAVLRVGWHTEGKGHRDSDTVGEWPFPPMAGQLVANVPISQSFTCNLPRNPWSYAGRLINSVWTVGIHIDVPRGEDIREVQPFILAPRR